MLTTVTVTTAGGVILVPLGGWTPPSTAALGLQALAAVLLLIGYQLIIVLSGLYAFYRERVRHRTLAAESSGLPPDGL